MLLQSSFLCFYFSIFQFISFKRSFYVLKILCRLTSIIGQFNPLVQQVAALRKKEFWYKQIIEIKCSNLRKAEAEVSLVSKVSSILFFKLLSYIYHSTPKLRKETLGSWLIKFQA